MRAFKNFNILITLAYIARCSYRIYLFSSEAKFYDFVSDGYITPNGSAIGIYAIGAILGASAVPLMLWASYWIIIMKNNYIANQEKAKLISSIENSDEFGSEFIKKRDAVNGLLKVQAISQEEYQDKMDVIIEKAAQVLRSSAIQKNKQSQQIELQKALESGVISQDEYSERVTMLENQIKHPQKIETKDKVLAMVIAFLFAGIVLAIIVGFFFMN